MTWDSNALDIRYNSLLSLHNKITRSKIFTAISIILTFGSLLFMTQIASAIGIDVKYSIFIPVAIGFFAILISSRFNKRVMKQDDYVFFTFCDIYKKLHTFIHSKTDESFNSTVKSIKLLSDYMGLWAPTAPDVVSRLPKSISINLICKLLPLVREEHEKGGKLQILDSFNNAMMNMVYSISSVGLTLQTLDRLYETLNQLPSSSLPFPIKKENITSRYPSIKYVWIPILTGFGLFYIFNIVDPTKLQTSLGYSLTISTAVLIGVIHLTKKNKT